MNYMPTINFLYTFPEHFEITAAAQRDSEIGITLDGTPEIILGGALLLSVFYIIRKLKKSSTNSQYWCETCNTKQFIFYESKKSIVCVENFNFFFIHISFWVLAIGF
jgi:hypothetical protein